MITASVHQVDITQRAALAAARRTIQREISSMDTGFARKDKKASYVFYSPNYSRTGFDGKTYHLNDDLTGADKLMSEMQSDNAQSRIESVTLDGGRADVLVHVHAVVNLLDTTVTPTAIEHIEQDEARKQTWIRSGSVWLMLTSVSTSGTIRIYENGKLLESLVNGKPEKV